MPATEITAMQESLVDAFVHRMFIRKAHDGFDEAFRADRRELYATCKSNKPPP
jgi:hypothetical protein